MASVVILLLGSSWVCKIPRLPDSTSRTNFVVEILARKLKERSVGLVVNTKLSVRVTAEVFRKSDLYGFTKEDSCSTTARMVTNKKGIVDLG